MGECWKYRRQLNAKQEREAAAGGGVGGRNRLQWVDRAEGRCGVTDGKGPPRQSQWAALKAGQRKTEAGVKGPESIAYS